MEKEDSLKKYILVCAEKIKIHKKNPDAKQTKSGWQMDLFKVHKNIHNKTLICDIIGSDNLLI